MRLVYTAEGPYVQFDLPTTPSMAAPQQPSESFPVEIPLGQAGLLLGELDSLTISSDSPFSGALMRELGDRLFSLLVLQREIGANHTLSTEACE